MDVNRVEQSFMSTRDGCCTQAQGGIVATAFPEATNAGVEVLKKGGNAVDTAIASALALCVCEPQACGIGGQSSILLHINGCSFALEGSGKIPALLDRKQMTHDDVVSGYKATTVPTTLAVLSYTHKRFGELPWSEVIAPAIRIASEGYRISKLQNYLLKREQQLFSLSDSGSGPRYFFKNRQTAYAPGELFIQPELAAVLKVVSEKGVETFYRGDIAGILDEDMRKNGGFLRKEDLFDIPWPSEKPVIRTKFLDHTIITMPPPTQGRVLLMILQILEQLFENGITPESRNWPLYLAEALSAGYEERMNSPFCPESYNADIDPVLISRNFARDQVDRILRRQHQSLSLPQLQGGETTHLSVMDAKGDSVCITQSVNMVYGSKVAAESLGFIYNNYLIDCWSFDNDHTYGLKSGGRAPSSLAPFMIMKEGKPWLSAGSPGSQRIVSTLAQFITHILYSNMSISKAMMMPRLHSQERGKILIEEGGFPPEVVEVLKESGFAVEEKASFYFGAIHAVLAKQSSPGFQGVAEMRRDGTVKGPIIS